MTTVNMDAIQFYNPAFTTPSITARCATSFRKQPQSTGTRHLEEMSRVLKPYSQSQGVCKDIAGKQDGHASDGPTATDEDDEFLPIDEVIRRALSNELSTKEPTSAPCTSQEINKPSSPDPESSSMPAQSRFPGFFDGSKGTFIDFSQLRPSRR